MSTKKEYKILAAEVRFLKKQLEVVEDLFKDALVEFNQKILKEMSLLESPAEKHSEASDLNKCEKVAPNQKETQNPQKSNEENNIKEEDQRRLFKQIANKAHPDKLIDKSEFEKEFKKSLFERARQAIQENDYLSLTEVAEALDIQIPEPEKKHLENLINTKKRISKKTQEIKNSYAWMWYFEKDSNRKKLIIEKFIEQVKKGCK